MIKRRPGFTVIELLLIVVVLGTASLLFFMQQNNVEMAARDQQRKTAINAIYYSLEEVYYKTNGYYPMTISQANLPSVDPALFTDPYGVKLGDPKSNYRYEPVNCLNNQCKSYSLRTSLENEADFVKNSRHQ